MHKYLLPFLMMATVSCKSGEETPASLIITRQNNALGISIEGVEDPAAVLLVNGQAYMPFKIGETTTITEDALRPGKNLIQVVRPATGDTLSDSAHFSYNISYTLVKEYPHDTEKFTQGLFLQGNDLYESTGLEGKSGIWKYKMDSDSFREYQSTHNTDAIFGEGIAAVGNKLFQLSWENKVVFEYDKQSLKKLREFSYPYEGWGLTTNGDSLIASDGSDQLYFINPSDFRIYHQVSVRGNEGKITYLNELELVGNIVLANIWQSNTIAFIDKNSGNVLATADLSALSQSAHQEQPKADVLNGIAYDPADGTLLVTGKLWPKMYRIKLDSRFDKIKQ